MERIHGGEEDLVSSYEAYQVSVVTDTHSLYWFLTADKRLSRTAKNTIEESETIIIPTIVLLELLYLFQRKKQAELFPVAFENFKNEKKYIFASLDLAVVEEVLKVSATLEMHDSIIVATAKMMDAPIVTRDRTVRKIYKQTIW